jgi:hypothetical protein
MHVWLGSYIKDALFLHKNLSEHKPVHVMFCHVDHFEPKWQNPGIEIERDRVNEWVNNYPKLAENHRDADGCFPKHTFFYPAEEYRPEHLEKLAALVEAGYGEVEIHLHHDNDTSEGLFEKLREFKKQLLEHNLLRKNFEGQKLRFGFIHGNWALDNSRKDGRLCGVNNELIVLKNAGCYADFTLPSAPSETQTKKINSIYYAKDDPDQPKSHNTGVDVEVGKSPSGDLMIVQGPLALNWKDRKWGVLPKIDQASIDQVKVPNNDRVDLWIRQAISVKGKEDWIFVKVHSHGAMEAGFPVLLGKPRDRMLSYLETKYNDGENFILHYVTAREMYNIIKAAENGEKGNPNNFRDYILKEKTVGR